MSNKFAEFQNQIDAQEEVPVQATQKPAAGKNAGHGREPQKKIVVKKVQNVSNTQMVEGGFEVEGQRQSRGGFKNNAENNRGGRGGRGGRGRGNNGSSYVTDGDRKQDGERRPRTEGGDRPRGGRGRGGRGGQEGGENRPARGGRGNGDRPADTRKEGERKPFAGKPREGAHPFDRKSGTGRGKRDQQKSGGGRGQWGDAKQDKPEVEGDAEKVEGETEVKQAEEEKKVEEPEPVVEEEPDVYMNLDDYLKIKKTVKTAEAREHIGITDKKVQEDKTERQRTEQQLVKAAGGESHAVRPGQGAELFGFQAGADAGEEFESRGAGRGRGARGGRAGPRDQAPRTNNKGRRGGKVVTNDENDFPTL